MESSEKQERSSSSPQGLIEVVQIHKCCSICKTTKTPLWRSGPSGPKSLCNACGIRHRKKRPGDVKKGKMGKGRNVKERKGLVMMMMMPPLEKEGEQGQGSPVPRRRSPAGQWGEVERAAPLLRALSCGAVFT